MFVTNCPTQIPNGTQAPASRLIIVTEIFGRIETCTWKRRVATTCSELRIYSIANTTDSENAELHASRVNNKLFVAELNWIYNSGSHSRRRYQLWPHNPAIAHGHLQN